MGFWDKIKKRVKKGVEKVKETYKRADKAVGGYLPGGPTPTEVRKPEPTPTPTVAPKVTERKKTTPKLGDPLIPGVTQVGEERGEAGMEQDPYRQAEATKMLEAGFTQEDIDAGMTFASAGMASPVTASDIINVMGAGAVVKAGLKYVMTKGATKAAETAAQTTTFGPGKLYRTYTTFGEVAAGVIKTNVKTEAQATALITKSFSAKALALMGGASAWVGSVTIGKWGQAEGPEAIQFAMNKAMSTAEETGDWSIYDEATEARDELLDLSIWEKIALWSPASFAVGIPMKIQGGISQGIVMDKVAEDKKIQQETGESEDEKWKRVKEEQAEQDKIAIDYYNDERKKLLEWEREAKKEARNEDAAFWRKEREAQMKKEAEDRQAIADFWEAYKKQMQKMQEDSRPSNLKFGLL